MTTPRPSEPLSARQRAMLAEMGIRVWSRGAADTDADAGRAPRPSRSDADNAAHTGHAAHAAHASNTGKPPPRQAAEPARAAARPASVPVAHPAASAPPPAAAPGLTPRPSPEALAAMDWAALEAAVTACRACALCAGRTQTVFGTGSRRADWMVVGEAPGEQEDRLGQPFVGPSGQLLDRMLAAIGVSRTAGAQPPSGPGGAPDAAAPATSDTAASASPDTTPESPAPPKKPGGVYIANVLKCRPPGNRNPQPDEVACCEPYLRRQVALAQPKIILAMGRFAVQSLLQTADPIGRLRGRAHTYHGVPVIVTYHPAYLLRSLPEKAKAWQDLCLALETAKGR